MYAKYFLARKKEARLAVLENLEKDKVRRFPCCTCISRFVLSDIMMLLYPIPFALFLFILHVKLDYPEKLSWQFVFLPLYLLDVLLLLPLASYILHKLHFKAMFSVEIEHILYRSHLSYYILKRIQRSSRLLELYSFPVLLITQILFPVLISNWVIFTFLLPIALDQQNVVLLEDAAFIQVLLIGIITCWYCTLFVHYTLHTQPDATFTFLPFLLSTFSLIPCSLLSSILWYLKHRFHLIKSYTFCLVPLFISQTLIILSHIVDFIYPYIDRRYYFISCSEFASFSSITYLPLAPFLIFEIMLLKSSNVSFHYG